jgi:hypothetical protein
MSKFPAGNLTLPSGNPKNPGENSTLLAGNPKFPRENLTNSRLEFDISCGRSNILGQKVH